FFFSSRRRHTRFSRDWSSDVCSSDLQARLGAHRAQAVLVNQACGAGLLALDAAAGKFALYEDCRTALVVAANRVCDAYWNRMERSEERRVGKECRVGGGGGRGTENKG